MRNLVLLSVVFALGGCTAEQNAAREQLGAAMQGAGAGLQAAGAPPQNMPQHYTVCPKDGGPCQSYIVHER